MCLCGHSISMSNILGSQDMGKVCSGHFFFFAALAQQCCCYPSQPIGTEPCITPHECIQGISVNWSDAEIQTRQNMYILPVYLCCSVCFHFIFSICPMNDREDSEQRRMRDPRSVFISHSLEDLLLL